MKRRVRLGTAARRRVRRGGKLAVGRASETLAGWRATKAAVEVRAGGRCEIHRTHRGTDFHHVVARSHGGRDIPQNIVLLCRQAHDQVSAPYSRGRLCLWSAGDGFFWHVVRVSDSAWLVIECSGFIPFAVSR